jgi:ABC-type antimicrobial peptide transport system permease subunit
MVEKFSRTRPGDVRLIVHQILQRIVQRPGRAVLTCAALAVEVAFVILITGLSANPSESPLTVLTGFVLVISFLLVVLAMYRAALGQTREIGILKSLGASSAYIYAAILGEASLLCVVGIVVGMAAACLVSRLLQIVYGSLPIDLTFVWIGRTAAIVITGSLVGAGVCAASAIRKDPAETVDHE